MRRPRGPGGRFLSVAERAALELQESEQAAAQTGYTTSKDQYIDQKQQNSAKTSNYIPPQTMTSSTVISKLSMQLPITG